MRLIRWPPAAAASRTVTSLGAISRAVRCGARGTVATAVKVRVAARVAVPEDRRVDVAQVPDVLLGERRGHVRLGQGRAGPLLGGLSHLQVLPRGVVITLPDRPVVAAFVDVFADAAIEAVVAVLGDQGISFIVPDAVGVAVREDPPEAVPRIVLAAWYTFCGKNVPSPAQTSRFCTGGRVPLSARLSRHRC